MRPETIKRKNILINQAKLTRVQQLLNARTETEAIGNALSASITSAGEALWERCGVASVDGGELDVVSLGEE